MPTTSKQSLQWLYSMVPKLRSYKIPEEAFNPRKSNSVFIGGVFLYGYDPKHKETLPWYDTLPLVIPIEIYNDGWLGLNLHYLPKRQRRALLDKLDSYRRRVGDPRSYMALSYRMLSAAAKSSLFEPCLHRYLANHVTSRLLRIDDGYWPEVVELPIQQFKKASASEVWRQHRPQRRKRK